MYIYIYIHIYIYICINMYIYDVIDAIDVGITAIIVIIQWYQDTDMHVCIYIDKYMYMIFDFFISSIGKYRSTHVSPYEYVHTYI
jgi:hypothetical protein